MGSVNWEKFKTAPEAKAIMMHNDKDERLQHNHSNKDIDKTLTPLNMDFCGRTYAESCKAYDDRLAKLDSQPGANRRKDRVTMVGLSIPVPEGMPDDVARKWLTDVAGMVRDMAGSENVLLMQAHFDERHDYVDAESGQQRTSRVHLHANLIPAVDGKLNARAFTARRRIVELNNAIQHLTETDYPGYTFMDGSKKASKKSVEQLKAESKEAARILDEARQEGQRIADSAKQWADDYLKTAVDAVSTAEKEIHHRQKQVADRETAADARESALDARQTALDARAEEIAAQAAEAAAAASRASEAQRLREEEIRRREERVKKREAAADVTEKQQKQKEMSLKDDIRQVAALKKQYQSGLSYLQRLSDTLDDDPTIKAYRQRRDQILAARKGKQAASDIRKQVSAGPRLPEGAEDMLRKYEQRYDIQDDQDDQMSF